MNSGDAFDTIVLEFFLKFCFPLIPQIITIKELLSLTFQS